MPRSLNLEFFAARDEFELQQYKRRRKYPAAFLRLLHCCIWESRISARILLAAKGAA